MDNRRLILLLVFSFSLVMLWDSWQKYNQPKLPATAATAAGSASSSVPVPSAATSTASPTAAAAVPALAPAATVGQVVRVKNDLFTATISTQGGDIVNLELDRYRAGDDNDKNFSLFEAKHQYVAQSGLVGEGLPNHKTLFNAVGGDKEMAACAKSVNEMLAVCAALQRLATTDSRFLPKYATLAGEVCEACEKECRKHETKHAECKACADSCAVCLKECKKIAA